MKGRAHYAYLLPTEAGIPPLEDSKAPKTRCSTSFHSITYGRLQRCSVFFVKSLKYLFPDARNACGALWRCPCDEGRAGKHHIFTMLMVREILLTANIDRIVHVAPLFFCFSGSTRSQLFSGESAIPVLRAASMLPQNSWNIHTVLTIKSLITLRQYSRTQENGLKQRYAVEES